MRTLLIFLILLWTAPAWAQNVTCATRPPGDSSNACASTAFVQNNTTPGTFLATAFGVSTAQADNGPLINTALTYCNANGGGTVQLPAGTLNLTTDITMTSNCHLKGAGRGTSAYQGVTPAAVAVTKLNWLGVNDATGVIRFLGNNSNWIANSGVSDLTIDGNQANPTNYGMAGIYLDGWGPHNNFDNITIANIAIGVAYGNGVSDHGTPANNLWGFLEIENVFEGLLFRAGTSEHFQHIQIEKFYHIAIDFNSQCDSNTFDFVIASSFNAPGSTAIGIYFNSAITDTDVFGETFGYVFLNMSQNATEFSIIVNDTSHGAANTIAALELGYQGVLPVISTNGVLQYHVINGFDLHTDVTSWQTITPSLIHQLPTVDATFCNAGGGAVVDPRSTANRGVITVGATAVSCIVFFPVSVNGMASPGWPPNSSPVCTVTDYTRNAALKLNGAPSPVSFTVQDTTGGDTFGYICF